jgi:hypothetical protein
VSQVWNQTKLMKPVYEDPHMLKIPGEEFEGEDDIFCDCVDEVNVDGDDDRRTSDGTKNFSSLYTCSNRALCFKSFFTVTYKLKS